MGPTENTNSGQPGMPTDGSGMPPTGVTPASDPGVSSPAMPVMPDAGATGAGAMPSAAPDEASMGDETANAMPPMPAMPSAPPEPMAPAGDAGAAPTTPSDPTAGMPGTAPQQ